MANDIVFKSKAFGGYDKTEVMNYINNLLAEKVELEKRLSESNVRFAQTNSQLFEMKKSADESAKLTEELSQAKEENLRLSASINEQNEKIQALETELSEKSAQIEELKTELNNCQTSEEAQNEIDSLRNEVSRLKVEAEKKRDLERQVGAAMLDARIHSEELVEEAKEKANAVTKSVYSAIGETALKIDGLSTGIGEIARSFTKSVEEVELRIKALTGDMSKTAQLLISESGVITEGKDVDSSIEYDFSKDEDVVTEISIDPSDYGVDNIDKIEFTDDSDI